MRPHVDVHARDAFAVDGVLDRDLPGRAPDHPGIGDHSVGEREDRGAVGCCPVGAGVEAPLAGERICAPSEVGGVGVGAVGQREHERGGLRDVRVAGHSRPRPTSGGQGLQDRPGGGLVVAVAIRIRGHLDRLRGLAFVHLLPAEDVQQATRRGVVRAVRPAVERPGLVAGVHQLGDGAPPGGRAHLEQPERVVIRAVAVVGEVPGFGVRAGVRELAQRGLGQCGHQRDDDPVAPDPGCAGAGLDDGGGVGELLPVQRERGPVRGRDLQLVRDRSEDHAAGDAHRLVGHRGVDQHPDTDHREHRGQQHPEQQRDKSLLHRLDPRSAQRVVLLRQAQQDAPVGGRRAGQEHGEGDRML